MKKIYSMVVLLLLTTFTVFAQHGHGKKPLLSPRAYVKTANLEVSYGQPSMRGRKIFGGLVPYGQVWRTGANEATEITFKKDAMFGGKHVKAGTYTLFTIPGENEWTVILNSQLKQWGAFGYEKVKDKDVLHIKVPAMHTDKVVEKFTIMDTREGLTMEWDKTKVNIPVKF